MAALPPVRRWVLQGDAEKLGAAWPGGLPATILGSTAAEGYAALKLGPDEWLLIAPVASASPETPTAGALVEVSDRQLAFELAGPAAATLFNAGNPLDLSDAAFPAGRATRTIFGKVEVVLWRPTAEPLWRIEVWRSYAPYLLRYLIRAVADL